MRRGARFEEGQTLTAAALNSMLERIELLEEAVLGAPIIDGELREQLVDAAERGRAIRFTE